jgi:hypothetical protein
VCAHAGARGGGGGPPGLVVATEALGRLGANLNRAESNLSSSPLGIATGSGHATAADCSGGTVRRGRLGRGGGVITGPGDAARRAATMAVRPGRRSKRNCGREGGGGMRRGADPEALGGLPPPAARAAHQPAPARRRYPLESQLSGSGALAWPELDLNPS